MFFYLSTRIWRHFVDKFLINCILFFIITAISITAQAKANKLHIYNWSDYIAPDTINNFEMQSGIDVSYDVFDSNEVLDGKLMSGKTGFDIVVPTDSFLARQINANVYLPLDKTLLPNYFHLDDKLMKMMSYHDPHNTYAIPYMWQSTGIGYNVNKVKQLLGDEIPLDSWDLVFNPNNLKKLSQCGVALLDAPSEIFPTVLNYLGIDPNSRNREDHQQATDFLLQLRPYVTYFHNSKYINDLSGGDICIAIGWSGDIMQAIDAADDAGQGVEIDYFVPKEGAIITFDVLAIPKGARNIDEAYQFLNYLLEPEVIANISNSIFYPNANKDAFPYLNDEVKNNPGIYPDDEVISRLFLISEHPADVDRMVVRLWTRVLSGQ